MVKNFVKATYSETYDLNTLVDEMSLIGIHTPQAPQLKKMFKGYFTQYKKYKIASCSIRMVCAGTLPLSPTLVGMQEGQMDPRDVMNPMLFKACTGENLNAILNQIYSRTYEIPGNTYGNGSIGQIVDEQTPAGQTPPGVGGTTTIEAYYQMLADPTFRKAHPMAGIRIGRLRPFVHKVATTQPFRWQGYLGNSGQSRPCSGRQQSSTPDTANQMYGFGAPVDNVSRDVVTFGQNASVFVSNGISPMPWMDTTVLRSGEVVSVDGTESIVGNWYITDVPRVYMGCLILPPAKSTVQYFRAIVKWTILFKEFRPAYEVGAVKISGEEDSVSNGFGGIDQVGSLYFNYYHDTETAKLMDKETSSFSANSTEIDMINAEAR